MRSVLLVAVLLGVGCTEAVEVSGDQLVTADAGADGGGAEVATPPACPADAPSMMCAAPGGGFLFSGSYVCARWTGDVKGCTYRSGGETVLIVVSCSECQPH